MKTYKVQIFSIKNPKKAVATIGENLSEKQADKRQLTGLSRIDRENYFVGIAEEK